MHRLLISAALIALAAPAFVDTASAQPGDPSQIRGKGGFGQYQERQAQGGNGGPTNFTNQIPQGQAPGPNGEPPRGGGDRGGRGPQQQAAPQQQPQGRQPDQDRGRDRGDWNRGDRNGDRGNWQGRDNRGPGNFDNRRGFDNRQGWDNRSGGFNGQRRDWRSYNNYHRDWRPTRRFRAPDYRRPPGFYAHRWSFGEFLPSLFWSQRSYWLDYDAYDLPPPPPGAVWVRVDDDALLIDQYSGEIITVAYGVFY